MKFYTVQEVADSLNVHPNTIRNWINSGDLNSYKLGNALRISEIDFLHTKLEENERVDFNGSDAYINGLLDGESELIKELIMKMQKEVIGWHY